MQSRKVLFVAALVLWSAPGCSLFDPPEVRMAKAMNRQMETMQQVVDEFDKGIEEREQRGRR
jgi:hypothetical protein